MSGPAASGVLGQERWWQGLYDELLAEMLLVRDDPAELEATVELLVRALELRPGARVLDQCCGIGGLALPLARRGFEVVGVDLIEGYVARARAEARAQGLPAEFFQGDAFEFVPSPRCDGAFNWWTSFGYAAEDAENQRMLERAREALRPGGLFLLDTMHVPGVLRGFQPHVVRRRETPRGEVVLLRESEVDLRGGAMTKRWTYFLPDGQRSLHMSRVRLYMPDALVRLFEAAGFVEVELFGELGGGALELDSPRCLVRGRAPERRR